MPSSAPSQSSSNRPAARAANLTHHGLERAHHIPPSRRHGGRRLEPSERPATVDHLPSSPKTVGSRCTVPRAVTEGRCPLGQTGDHVAVYEKSMALAQVTSLVSLVNSSSYWGESCVISCPMGRTPSDFVVAGGSNIRVLLTLAPLCKNPLPPAARADTHQALDVQLLHIIPNLPTWIHRWWR